MNYVYKEIDDEVDGLIAVEISVNNISINNIEQFVENISFIYGETDDVFINEIDDNGLVISMDVLVDNIDEYIERTVNEIISNCNI